ncbi:MAG: penicillin acylase family protein [Candidatus Promineifilaceae bacterium]
MKWIVRLLTLLTLLFIGLLLVAFWPFPQQYRLDSAEIPYNTEIIRDTWGVPHIYGQTDADAAFGLAYAHAEDDFLTLQQGLIAARGDLAKTYGLDAAANDYMVALLRIQDVVDNGYDSQLSPEVRAVCEAYAAGLNLYASQHPDEVFPDTFPVTGKDIVAGSVHKSPLFFGLDGTLGRLFEAVNSDSASLIDEAQFAFGKSDDMAFTGIGSNAFAVGPSRTSDGSTYLAVNSHQPWTGPVAWYEAHMHSEEGLNMTGGLFPGMPVVTLGHNEALGWGFTVNHPDLIDVFELELNPDNPDQYLLDDVWRDFRIWDATLEVNLVASADLGDEYSGNLNYPATREIVWSEFGPVLRNDQQAFAIRFAGFGSVGIYEQLYWMNKASNFAEWQQALQIEGLPMFNVAYGDRDGNIYYAYNALLPDRQEGLNWDDDLQGTSSDLIWGGYRPFQELPQVLNPIAGYVQNANSTPFKTTLAPENPSPQSVSPTSGIELFMTNRALRLNELLSADTSMSWDAFKAIKFDMVFSAESDMADWVARIGRMSFDDPHAQQAQQTLSDWDLSTDPGSSGASLAILTLHFLNQDKDAKVNVSRLGDASNVPDDVLSQAFTNAVQVIVDQHNANFDVAWAQLNRVRRGYTDMGIGGSPDVAHAVYGVLGGDGRFDGVAGDSFVQLVRWDANGVVHSESIHQFGSATLDESSPHYADQVPLFVNRELKPVWFTEDAVRANMKESYRPQDRGEEKVVAE